MKDLRRSEAEMAKQMTHFSATDWLSPVAPDHKHYDMTPFFGPDG